MPIPDKIAAANKINEFLRGVVANAGLRLKYRITVDPPLPEERDWERPEILVEFAGPDSALMLERGAELLRSIELLAIEMLRLSGNGYGTRTVFAEFAWRPAWRRRKFGRLGRPTSLRQCLRGNGASCIWRCGMRRICARRAKARACGDVWWCIRRITGA